MTKALYEMLRSKKFLAALAALLAIIIQWILAAAGMQVEDADIYKVLLVLMTYILGQGMADLGKAAKK